MNCFVLARIPLDRSSLTSTTNTSVGVSPFCNFTTSSPLQLTPSYCRLKMMERHLGLFLNLLTAVTTATAQMTCSHSSNALPYLQFCTKINYDVLGPASQSAHVIDQIAKQTYVQSLHMHSSCGGKVLSKQCSIAFRQYSCAYHFPKCVNATATTATHLLPPCREVCEHYCSVCNMAGCPCFDLPIKAAEGAAPTCQSLEA